VPYELESSQSLERKALLKRIAIVSRPCPTTREAVYQSNLTESYAVWREEELDWYRPILPLIRFQDGH
jgi:hypothetical protein